MLPKACTALISGLLVLSISAHAKPFVTIVCDVPKGSRIEVTKASSDLFKVTEDSFTGVHPTFILDDSDTTRLTYIFNNTQGAPNRGARVAQIVALTSTMLTAVETSESEIAMFTIYYGEGLGFFTFYELHPLSGADAKSSTFTSRCATSAD